MYTETNNLQKHLHFSHPFANIRKIPIHPSGAMDPLPFSFRKDESRNEVGGGGGGGGGDYWCSDREVVDAGASGGAGGGRP